MNYRLLGRTGIRVSAFGLGAMQFGWWADQEASFAILDAYLEAGGNFIDTANAYQRGGSETIVGDWLKSRGARHRVILATKVGNPMGDGPNDVGQSRRAIMDQIEGSLRRLQTDYVDLYQTHYSDYATPLEETLGALDDLVRQGKVRIIGTSNHRAWELVEALWASDKRALEHYATLQPHYNLIHRDEYERELRAVCTQHGLGVVPFSPLEYGFLSGKYRPDQVPESARARQVTSRVFNDRSWTILEAVDAIAADHGASDTAVSLAWLLAQPTVTAPILGCRTLDQLRDCLTGLDVMLSPDEVGRLNEVSAWPDSATRPPGTVARPAAGVRW